MHKLFLSAALMAAASVAAGSDLSEALKRCSTIEDENQRLTCFDEASRAAGLESEAATSAAPTTEPAAPPTTPAAQTSAPASAPTTTAGSASPTPPFSENEFGLERQREKEGVQQIRSQHVGQFNGWKGDTFFPLANGQVWKQIESGHYSYSADQPMLVIKRGIFQSYYLKVDGQNRTVRVTRVR